MTMYRFMMKFSSNIHLEMWKRHVQILFICCMIHTCVHGGAYQYYTFYSYFEYPFFHIRYLLSFFLLLLMLPSSATRVWFWLNHLFGKNWFISWDSYEYHDEIVSTMKTICHKRIVKTITFPMSSLFHSPFSLPRRACFEIMFVCGILFSANHLPSSQQRISILSLYTFQDSFIFSLRFSLSLSQFTIRHWIQLHTTVCTNYYIYKYVYVRV